ncbi:unnamed protein product [Durusdinium trenchii]|uniref:DDHD domain-containing protein n=1 Tax=Durusdinium trenchii TaxID=1381693 RepID=A0ABP0J4N4_9DINO
MVCGFTTKSHLRLAGKLLAAWTSRGWKTPEQKQRAPLGMEQRMTEKRRRPAPPLQPLPDLPAAHPSAVVFFGRAEVFLFGAGRSRGVLRERYGGGLLERHGPFHVRRSQWFCMARQGPRPYGPTLNERLSAAHARLMEVAQGGDSSPELKETSASPSSSKEETVTFGRKSVRLYIAWGKVQAVEEEADSNMRFWLGLSGPVVQRGFEVPVDEEELLQEKVGQIVVVVHGIGEKFAQRRWGGLVHDVGVLRRTLLHAQLKLCGFVQKDGRWQEGEDPVASGPKIEVLVSEWWQSVHSEEMDQQLSSITLPSLSAVRDFANLSLVDGLAFMQERSKVIAATSASIERTVARFKECHPQFKGQIFLLGHSLGGVISWDIIKEKRLSFTPSALFTLGSPLGVFLHTASGVQGKPSMDELGKVRFFNIFHPLDPVAYRMEPLLWPHGPCPPAPAQLNDRDACHAQRVDWALPLAALSSASELLQAVPSHISYYKNPDLGTFILRQCIRSPASTAQVATAARRLTASLTTSALQALVGFSRIARIQLDARFYRLAVKQAESLYDIMAPHPIFLKWVGGAAGGPGIGGAWDPHQEVKALHVQGFQNFLVFSGSNLIFCIFAVTLASARFAFLGRSRSPYDEVLGEAP